MTSGAGQPRRLAIVSDAIYPFTRGGKELRIQALSQQLARAGFDVHIYTMKWWKGPNVRRQENITLHAICPRLPLYTKNGRRSIWQGVVFAMATLKLITQRFDVLEVDHMPIIPLFCTRVVATLHRRPLYGVWHEVWGRQLWNAYLPKPLAFIATILEKLSIYIPNHIIAVSDQTASALRHHLGYRGPLTVAANGLDFDSIAKVPAAETHSDLIFVGRLIAHKNVPLLISATALLRKNYPHIKLIVIGDGPQAAELQAQIKDLGLQTNVSLLSGIDDSQKFALMKSSKVFVTPSSREGFGITVLEANAADLPVVTINTPENAARHLITAANGTVCESTAEALTEAISYWLKHPHAHRAQHIAKTYDWSVPAQKLIAEYQAA